MPLMEWLANTPEPEPVVPVPPELGSLPVPPADGSAIFEPPRFVSPVGAGVPAFDDVDDVEDVPPPRPVSPPESPSEGVLPGVLPVVSPGVVPEEEEPPELVLLDEDPSTPPLEPLEPLEGLPVLVDDPPSPPFAGGSGSLLPPEEVGDDG